MSVHRVGDRFAAVTEARPSGFGPEVWVAELRTLDGRPLVAWWHSGGRGHVSECAVGSSHRCWPVSVGSTEADALAGVRTRAIHVQAAGR